MSTIKVDTITSSDGLGAPELPYGLAISAAFTLNGTGNAYINRSVNSGSLTFAGGTGIDAGQTSGGLIARGSTDSYNAGGVEVYAGGSERLVINSAGNATFSGVITTDGMTTSADINFGDSDKAIFGAGSDLQIYHDGTNSYISDQGTNDLKVLATDFQLKNSADNEFMMTAVTDGAVTLYHNNAAKLATTATGIDVTGVITTDGMTTSADINFGDDDKAIFGAGSDLHIFHNGSNSYIQDHGTGDLIIAGTNLSLRNFSTDELFFDGTANGAVRLWYDGAAKLATTSGGIDVTSGVGVSGSNFANTTYTGSSVNLTGVYTGLTSDSGFSLNVRDSGYLQFATSNTERVRLSAAGGLSVGTTVDAGAGNLLVAGLINSSKAGKNSFAGIDTTSYAAGVGGSIDLGGNYRTTGDASYFTRIAAEKTNGVNNDYGYDLGFYVTTNGGSTLGTKVATMTSSGRVGIGVSSPSDVLDVFGSILSSGTTQNRSLRLVNNSGTFEIAHRADISATIISTSATPLIISSSAEVTFGTAGSERARIDSSGNLLVGTTSTLESAVVSAYKSGLNGFAARITNNAFWNFVGINASNVRTFLVYGDGDVENTNNSYGAISDSRFKSNIVDASSQIEDVMAMKVRRYTLDSTGATHIGVIAQELEESGMSGLVKENLDGTKAVRYSVLYMKAVKALQEAIARIETLEAEVAALKGAN